MVRLRAISLKEQLTVAAMQFSAAFRRRTGRWASISEAEPAGLWGVLPCP